MRLNLFLIGVLWIGAVLPPCHAQTPVPPPARSESKSAATDTSLDLPPLPRSEVSLIGGTVVRTDPIRDRIVVRAFGGKDLTLDFDVRTQILQGMNVLSVRDIRPGTRIYADTIS